MQNKGNVLLAALIISVSGLMAGTLTITKDGPGDGYIRVNGVDQTLPFSQSYPAGTSMTLEAVPTDSKSQFMWWSGYINSTDNPVTFSIPVWGNPSIAASFTLSPPDIDYLWSVGIMASVLVGEYGELGYDISNRGGQTLVVVSTSITGPSASEFFIVSGGGAFDLAPGASHRIMIGYTFVSNGEKIIYVNVYSNDPDENPLLIYAWEHAMFPPDIASDPASWDFGSVAIGSHSDKTFTVRNPGDVELMVSSTTLTGPNASEFAIQSGGGSFAIDDGQRDVTVRFAPSSTGVKSASLTFNSNDPDENPFYVSLSGMGTTASVPDIASNPASWDYGAVSTGSSIDKTFVISNTGNADLSVTAVTLSGANASEFHIQSSGGSFTLAPAATRNVVVRFSPASSGAKNASMSFTSNDPDENPFLVYLTGDGRGLIVIDGNKDDFYNTLTGPENGYLNIPSPLYNGNGAPRDDRDLSANVWMAWDDTYLYLYEEVVDDTVHTTNPTDWANDCLEMKIDPDPSKQPTEGVITFNLTALDSADTEPAFYSGIANLGNKADKSDYARRQTAEGYVLELRVKWSDMIISGRGPVIPAVGNVFGLAINQHDNDRSGRQASVQWSAKLTDEVWFNPRLLGNVTFLAEHKLKMEAKNAIVDTLINPLAALYVPNDLPWPMLTMDMGSVQAAGSASYNDAAGTYTVSGSGGDIWNQADGFRYAFQQVSGNVELTARIVSLTKSDPWTKGGLMIRDELTANSAHAMMAVASDNGLTFQNRASTGAGCTYVAGNIAVKPPYWLKIVRSGNTLIGKASGDGVSWVEVGRKVIAMNDPVYVGMAVTAHRDGSLSTGTFSDVAFKFTDITGVEENSVSHIAPQGFALSQNYPNPFNNVTRLTYDLPQQAVVKIMIYDVMGREVRTLVNGMKSAGRHTIAFDASNLRSGIYFCDLECEGQHLVSKMMLLK